MLRVFSGLLDGINVSCSSELIGIVVNFLEASSEKFLCSESGIMKEAMWWCSASEITADFERRKTSGEIIPSLIHFLSLLQVSCNGPWLETSFFTRAL